PASRAGFAANGWPPDTASANEVGKGRGGRVSRMRRLRLMPSIFTRRETRQGRQRRPCGQRIRLSTGARPAARASAGTAMRQQLSITRRTAPPSWRTAQPGCRTKVAKISPITSEKSPNREGVSANRRGGLRVRLRSVVGGGARDGSRYDDEARPADVAGRASCRQSGLSARETVLVAERRDRLELDLGGAVETVALDHPGHHDDVGDARLGELCEAAGAVLVHAHHLDGEGLAV